MYLIPMYLVCAPNPHEGIPDMSVYAYTCPTCKNVCVYMCASTHGYINQIHMKGVVYLTHVKGACVCIPDAHVCVYRSHTKV